MTLKLSFSAVILYWIDLSSDGSLHRIRLAFEAIFRKSATLQDVNPDPEAGVGGGVDVPVAMGDLTDVPPAPASPRTYKKVQLV
jgi:chloride channel 2